MITAVFSFDVVAAKHSSIQLYGNEGSVQVPDPKTYVGLVSNFVHGDNECTVHEFSRPYVRNMLTGAHLTSSAGSRI